MSVGQRVAQLRAAHGESLREAAIRTGVSHTTIARIEKGAVTGSFQHTLRQIAQGYGVPFEFLLSDQDQVPPRPLPLGRFATDDELGNLPSQQIDAYISLIRKAAKAKLNPQTLELAIDLLIMQREQGEAIQVG
jgi:transcriptional regulator with XRE-family HTH domain